MNKSPSSMGPKTLENILLQLQQNLNKFPDIFDNFSRENDESVAA